jgi:hypothetical protein
MVLPPMVSKKFDPVTLALAVFANNPVKPNTTKTAVAIFIRAIF